MGIIIDSEQVMKNQILPLATLTGCIISRIPILSCCLLSLSVLCCNPQNNSTDKSLTDSTAQLSSTAATTNDVTVNWIDAFQEFSTAIAVKDLAKQKSFFVFPIDADSTQIWYAVYDKMPENEWPSPLPSTFSEADYDKYHSNLFPEDFQNGLPKVKIDSLLKDGEYTTPMINDGKIPYYLAVHFDETSQMLQFTLSYSGGVDEQGDYVSEGEYALIYLFKFEDGKTLRFDKMLFAG